MARVEGIIPASEPSIGQFYLAPGVGALRGQRLSRHSFTKSTVLILLC
jgi:hypothetical protein